MAAGHNATLDARKTFATSQGYGSIDDLYTKLSSMGTEGQSYTDRAMNQIGRNDTSGNDWWQTQVSQFLKRPAPPAPAAAPPPPVSTGPGPTPPPTPAPAPAPAPTPAPTPSLPAPAPMIGGLGASGSGASSMTGLSQVAQGEGFREGFMREGWGDQGAPSLQVPGGRQLPASSKALAQMATARGRVY